MDVVTQLYLFSQSIRIADLLDIFIIAFLIYSTLFLFKQTRSFLVVIGIGIVTLIYILAKTLNLYLTSAVLRSFFTVFLITLVVIFQEELRRFFTYLAEFGTRRIAVRSFSSYPIVKEIVDAARYLSRHQFGALLIIPGKENIERFIRGGKVLDGIISDDLIISIFDHGSPGHDGAMIIENDRVTRFSAQLPLSQNFMELGKHGTRHSAALGISEKSDALAIVVSEETGEVSTAYYGKLERIKKIDSLKTRIESHLKEYFPAHAYSVFGDLVKKNWLEKILALAISFILWFLVVFLKGR